MGSKPAYAKAARQLGHALASRNLGLVYGGTNVGTMGELANAALEAGGRSDWYRAQEIRQKKNRSCCAFRSASR